MELEVGPFDPALHIRSRDHYEAVRREAQLLSLSPEAAPARLEDLLDAIDRWAETESVQLLEAPDDVRRYRKAYLDQVRLQLQGSDG